MDLNLLKKETYEVSKKRGQSEKNAIKHLAGEVVELQEAQTAYYTIGNMINDSYKAMFKKKLGYEIADVIICACTIAEIHDIDIEQAITEKKEENKEQAENA